MPSYEKTSLNLVFRVRIALGVCCAFFFIIGIRLWYLQILKGDYFRDRSENNRIREVFLPPPRGLIFDRNGVTLAKNRPAFNVALVPEDSPNVEDTLQELSKLLGIQSSELISKMSEHRKSYPFEPKVVLEDVSRDTLAKVVAWKHSLQGIVIQVRPARDYVFGSLAAHVLGYLREITREQLESARYTSYRMGDVVGQYGIEAKWERYLQGQRGVQSLIVNASGVKKGEASFEREQIGRNITLTLDVNVQRVADEVLNGKKGAIVAMLPLSGEIIALSSSPSFDPNIFARGFHPLEWQELISGKEKRLNNRAVQGGYPPGSVFKIFVLAGALSEGVVDLKTQIFCPGSYYVGRRRFSCHKKSGHGSMDQRDALTQSCDVFFYTVGQRLSVDRIHDYASRFGLGIPTGLELVEENPGLIPSTEWKRKYFRRVEDQKWYPGETPSVAIGQGAVVTTPLQITRAVAALVNGGKVLKPLLVKKIESYDGTFLDDDFHTQIESLTEVEPWIVETVIQDMVSVVNDPRGTGKRAQLNQDLGITVGGKTGTAQAISMQARKSGDAFEDHAWFVGFAPAEKPEIVVTAMVENGGHGGVAAAPLVKQVMEAYFYGKKGKD